MSRAPLSRRSLLAAASAAAALPLVPAFSRQASAQSGRMTIAVLPTNTAEQLSCRRPRHRALPLPTAWDASVELVFPTSYAGVVESLRWPRPGRLHERLAAGLAKKHANAEATGRGARGLIGEESSEAPYYFSYWVVKTDSPHPRLEDLRGKKVALPRQLSTSGYVAPIGRHGGAGLLPREKARRWTRRSSSATCAPAGGYAQGWEALKPARWMRP